MMASPTTTLCPEVIFTPSTSDTQISTKAVTTTKFSLNTLSVHNSQITKRKFSFPASLHSSTLLTTESNSNVIARTTRRLSANVSDRVSERVRKLSTAMGLGWNHPSKELLLSQAKFLITLYVRFRIKRSVILNQQKKKVGLQKLQKTMLGIGDVKEVFLAIKEVRARAVNLHRIELIINSTSIHFFFSVIVGLHMLRANAPKSVHEYCKTGVTWAW